MHFFALCDQRIYSFILSIWFPQSFNYSLSIALSFFLSSSRHDALSSSISKGIRYSPPQTFATSRCTLEIRNYAHVILIVRMTFACSVIETTLPAARLLCVVSSQYFLPRTILRGIPLTPLRSRLGIPLLTTKCKDTSLM